MEAACSQPPPLLLQPRKGVIFFVLVLPFVAGWLRKHSVQEGSLFSKNLAAHI